MGRADEASQRAIAHALATSSGLGAFTVALGVLGMQRAFRLCASRRPTRAVLDAWEPLGYRVEQLPSAEDIRLFILGVEVHRRIVVARKNRADTPVSVVTKSMGVPQADINRGLRLVRSYNARVELPPDLGAI